MNAHCCCEPTQGVQGIMSSNWVWMLLVLCCCGVFDGAGNVLGDSLFRGNPPLIMILLLLYCCCFKNKKCC